MKTIISVSDFARHHGISRSRVLILIQAGRIEAYREGHLWKITSLKIKRAKYKGRPPKEL